MIHIFAFTSMSLELGCLCSSIMKVTSSQHLHCHGPMAAVIPISFLLVEDHDHSYIGRGRVSSMIPNVGTI